MLCQSQGSIDTYQQALHHVPNHPQHHYELGLAYHPTNSRQQALEYLKKALQLEVGPEIRLRIEGWIDEVSRQ